MCLKVKIRRMKSVREINDCYAYSNVCVCVCVSVCSLRRKRRLLVNHLNLLLSFQ